MVYTVQKSFELTFYFTLLKIVFKCEVMKAGQVPEPAATVPSVVVVGSGEVGKRGEEVGGVAQTVMLVGV